MHTRKESKTNENTHAKHRERLRKKVLEGGFRVLAPHEIAEFILFFSNARCDTNATAHALIKKFGSLYKIVDASIPELTSVKGVGPATAETIKLFLPLMREINASRAKPEKHVLKNYGAVKEYVRAQLEFLQNERLVMICLDTKGIITDNLIVAEGDHVSLTVDPKQIVRLAIEKHASTVILCHNHPTNNCLPSEADNKFTYSICMALSFANINLMDHLILGLDEDSIDGELYSYAELGFLDSWRDGSRPDFTPLSVKAKDGKFF